MSSRETGVSSGAVPVGRGVKRTWPFLVAGLLAVLDLALKMIAEQKLADGRILDFGLVNLRLLYNTGVSFSIGSTLPVGIIIGVTGLLILGIAIYLWKATKNGHMLPLLGISLVLGGAVGNFIDRLDGRGVVDYLHSGWFPTFNLADIFVVSGAALSVLGSFNSGPASQRPAGNLESHKAPISPHR